jgi:hypothetical protein
MSINATPGRSLTREAGVSLNGTPKESESCGGLDGLSGQTEARRKDGEPTVADVSVIDKTHARLSSLRVRIVSVRALSKARVRAVSYVAVKLPRVLYQAS